MIDVQFLGRGFYHVEFASSEMAQSIIKCSSVDMRGSMAFFNTWKQGFFPEDAIHFGGRIFPITTMFPGLQKEYFPFLREIGNQIGYVLDKDSLEQVNYGSGNCIPSIKIMLSYVSKLPTCIMLPKCDRGVWEQRIIFS